MRPIKAEQFRAAIKKARNVLHVCCCPFRCLLAHTHNGLISILLMDAGCNCAEWMRASQSWIKTDCKRFEISQIIYFAIASSFVRHFRLLLHEWSEMCEQQQPGKPTTSAPTTKNLQYTNDYYAMVQAADLFPSSSLRSSFAIFSRRYIVSQLFAYEIGLGLIKLLAACAARKTKTFAPDSVLV